MPDIEEYFPRMKGTGPEIVTIDASHVVGSITNAIKPATFTLTNTGAGAADFYVTNENTHLKLLEAIVNLPVTGGKLLLSAGEFYFGGALLQFISNLTVQGQGESTILKLANGVNSRMFYNPTTALSNITFRDLQIDGNGGNQVDGVSRDDRSLFMLFNITNFKLINCFIHDCRSGAAVRISACNRILYKGNTFVNNGMNGGAFQSDHTFTGDSNNYRVIGNHFENCTDTGTAQDGVIGSTVLGNTYKNCQGQAVSVSASPLRNSKHNAVGFNPIDGAGSTTSAGIKVSSFGNGGLQEDVTLMGNPIKNCDRAMWLDEFVNLKVIGNDLLDAQGDNKQLMLLGAVNTNTDLIVSNNTFKNTDNRGISFDGGSNIIKAKIHDNKFISVTTPIGGTIPLDAKIHDNQGFNSQSPANSIASANNLSLPGYNHYFPISGTTQINLIDITNFEGGSIITLRLQGTITIKHNQTASGNNKAIILNGAADFVAADGNTLTLAYDSIGSAWFETARKV